VGKKTPRKDLRIKVGLLVDVAKPCSGTTSDGKQQDGF
jgi:hypothetical protein